MATENTTQEEVLEETEQEELVEAPEQDEETAEKILIEKSKDNDDDEDEDDEEEEEEQVKKEHKVPVTKTAMIKALFDKVNGLKKEEVSARFSDLMGVAEASVEDLGGEDPATAKPEGDSVAVGKKKKKIKVQVPEINVKEDI